MMRRLAKIQPDHHVEIHDYLLQQETRPAWHLCSVSTLRREKQVPRPCSYQRYTDTTRPGENTPGSFMTRTKSHTGPSSQEPSPDGHEQGNGAQ
jgi:hypothetical protein